MTVQQIFDRWPSASELARDIGLKRPSHGTLMKFRGSIPVEHWPRLIAAAEARGIPDVTYETLALAHQRHPSPPLPPASAEAAGAPSS